MTNNLPPIPDQRIGSTEIENRFGFHKATIEGENATLPMHRELRLKMREFAEYLDELLPPGRAKNVAFTELENTSMWAHKAIAELSPLIVEVPSDESPQPLSVEEIIRKTRGV